MAIKGVKGHDIQPNSSSKTREFDQITHCLLTCARWRTFSGILVPSSEVHFEGECIACAARPVRWKRELSKQTDSSATNEIPCERSFQKGRPCECARDNFGLWKRGLCGWLVRHLGR